MSESEAPPEQAPLPTAGDLLATDPASHQIFWDSHNNKVWLLDATGARVRQLGTAAFVWGLKTVKLTCKCHRGHTARCQLLINTEVGYDVVEALLDRFFKVAAAYRVDADPRLTFDHHKEERLRMAAHVKGFAPMDKGASRAAAAAAASGLTTERWVTRRSE